MNRLPSSCFILILLTFFSFIVNAQEVKDSLDNALTSIAEKKILPGFATVIIRDGDVKYAEAFGWADIEDKKQYAVSSLQNIGSVSKTFIGVSLMKAEELGILDLDDPINKYLPYTINHPRHKKEITIRHLATHTASLNDPDEYETAYIFDQKIELDLESIPVDWHDYVKLYNTNKRMPLDDFVKQIYVPGGKYYSKKNFVKKKPGKKYRYSNIGAGIAARIIEIASGLSFEAFTKEHIFDPIGMSNTSWELSKIDLENKVTPYITYDIAIPHYSLITFADGGLITSVEDLSLYIVEMMKCYEGNGTVLSQEQCREMMKPYLPSKKNKYGIFWEISNSGLSIGHNGGDPGTVTNMYFMPTNGVAKILFANLMPTDQATGEAFGEVWKTLYTYQDRI